MNGFEDFFGPSTTDLAESMSRVVKMLLAQHGALLEVLEKKGTFEPADFDAYNKAYVRTLAMLDQKFEKAKDDKRASYEAENPGAKAREQGGVCECGHHQGDHRPGGMPRCVSGLARDMDGLLTEPVRPIPGATMVCACPGYVGRSAAR